MNLTIMVLAVLLLLGIVILIVHFLTTKTLATALGALISILSALTTGLISPGVEGKADIDLSLGPFGSIKGNLLQLNVSKPAELLVVAFVTISLLILVNLYFIYDSSKGNRRRN